MDLVSQDIYRSDTHILLQRNIRQMLWIWKRAYASMLKNVVLEKTWSLRMQMIL